MGSKEATPGGETTTQAKLPRDGTSEEERAELNEEVEECKELTWKVQPLSKMRILVRLVMANNGAEPGRSRTRNSQPRPELIRELGTDVDGGGGQQSGDTIFA